MKTETLSQLARRIQQDWKKINYAANPYLVAMTQLTDINQMHGYDSARDIVCYFLANAAGWRGEVAKAIKQELKDRLK